MSGPAMKPKTMAMVNDVYNIVKGSDVGVIASGGITTWEDIIEYAIAGAELFEVGTAFINYKTVEEKAQFTRSLWQGVQKFLKEQKTTLDKLVGSVKI